MADRSHSVQVRATRIMGITPDRIRVLPSDTAGRIDPGAVADAIVADRSAGCTPLVVLPEDCNSLFFNHFVKT